MADKKNKEKTSGSPDESKKESASKGSKGFLQSFMEPFFDQLTTEYTRPILKNIPPSVLLALKKIGVTKVLPVFSVVLSGLLQQKKTWWGERIGDVIAESTAELRRLIDEVGDGETTATEGAKVSGRAKGSVLDTLLNPELADEFNKLLSALATTVQAQGSEKNKNELFASLNSMGPEAVYNFLSLEDCERQSLLNIFFAKTEKKTLEQSIAEFKAEIQEAKATFDVVKVEVLLPAWKGFEQSQPVQTAMTTLAGKMKARIAEIEANKKRSILTI